MMEALFFVSSNDRRLLALKLLNSYVAVKKDEDDEEEEAGYHRYHTHTPLEVKALSFFTIIKTRINATPSGTGQATHLRPMWHRRRMKWKKLAREGTGSVRGALSSPKGREKEASL